MQLHIGHLYLLSFAAPQGTLPVSLDLLGPSSDSQVQKINSVATVANWSWKPRLNSEFQTFCTPTACTRTCEHNVRAFRIRRVLNQAIYLNIVLSDMIKMVALIHFLSKTNMKSGCRCSSKSSSHRRLSLLSTFFSHMGTQGLRTLEERSTLQLYSGFISARHSVIEGEKKKKKLMSPTIINGIHKWLQVKSLMIH